MNETAESKKVMNISTTALDSEEIEFKARVFISSLRDAVKCTQQICEIKIQRYMLSYYFSRYLESIRNKELLIGFQNIKNKEVKNKLNYNNEDGSNYESKEKLYLFSGLNKDSIYVFLLLNTGFQFYSKYSSKLDNCNEFHELNKLFTNIERDLKNDLLESIQNVKMQ